MLPYQEQLTSDRVFFCLSVSLVLLAANVFLRNIALQVVFVAACALSRFFSAGKVHPSRSNDSTEYSILRKKEDEDVCDCRGKQSRERMEGSEWLIDRDGSEETDVKCYRMVFDEDVSFMQAACVMRTRGTFANDVLEACGAGDTSGSIRVVETKEKRDKRILRIELTGGQAAQDGCRGPERIGSRTSEPLLCFDERDFTAPSHCLSGGHEMFLKAGYLPSLHGGKLKLLCRGDVSSLLASDVALCKTAAAPSVCVLPVVLSLRELAYRKILACTATRARELIARFWTRDKASGEKDVTVEAKISEESSFDGGGDEGSCSIHDMRDLHPVQQKSAISEVPAGEDASALSEMQQNPVAASDAGLRRETCSTESGHSSSSCTCASSCDAHVEATTEPSFAEDASAAWSRANDKDCKSKATQQKTLNGGDDVRSSDAGMTKVTPVSKLGDSKLAELDAVPSRTSAKDVADSSHWTQRNAGDGRDVTTANFSGFSKFTRKLPMPEVTLENETQFLGKTEKELWVEFKQMSASPSRREDRKLKNANDEDVNTKKYDGDGKDGKWWDLISNAALNPPFGFRPTGMSWTVQMLSASHSNAFLQQRLPSPPPRVVHDGYESESQRLASLAYLPTLEFRIYLIPLAGAGFYLPEDDETQRVKCAFCGVAEPIESFRDRQPMDVHRDISPRCPMVKGQASSNVTIAEQAHTSGMRFLQSHRVNVKHEPQLPPAASARQAAARVSESSGAVTASLEVDGEAVAPQLAVPETALPTAVGLSEVPQTARLQTANTQPSFIQAFAAQGKPFPPPLTPPVAAITAGGHTVPDSGQAPPALVVPSNPSFPKQPVSASSHQTDPSTSFSAPPVAAGTERKVVTYEQLGIINQTPVRPDLAVTATRIATFTANGWPHGQTHSPEIMADAGFYYTGHADLVRCFYCKGGLKTWMATDNPWIEHARWFPKCPYVRLCKGPKFVEAVKILNDPSTVPEISMEGIKREVRRMEQEERRNVEQFKLQPTVTDSQPSLMLMTTKDGLTACEAAATPGGEMGAVGGENPLQDFLLEGDAGDEGLENLSTRLQTENEELRSTTTCKICQQKEVSVLFLPCGHLIACAQCATALRKCAVCRQQVKGAVRVQTDCDEDEEEENDNGGREAER